MTEKPFILNFVIYSNSEIVSRISHSCDKKYHKEAYSTVGLDYLVKARLISDVSKCQLNTLNGFKVVQKI